MTLSVKIEKNLETIDEDFVKLLSLDEQELLFRYRKEEASCDEIIVKIGPKLESYIVGLFGIEKASRLLRAKLSGLKPIGYFYQHIALPSIRRIKVEKKDKVSKAVLKVVSEYRDDELSCIQKLLEYDHEDLMAWCQLVWSEKIEPYINWQVFSLPKKIDFNHLVKVKSIEPRMDYQWIGPSINQVGVEYHTQYCIECHTKDNDSCSKGFWLKKEGNYKVNPLGRVLIGCPLNQKISQMHGLRKQNQVIAALAVIMIDNPLCLVTGDRICNDCMLSCIYQKVDPVDTPSVESDILRQVLSLPYGAEIYLLLAKWNPLKQKEYLHKVSNVGNVAVVGMGPSGIAMSYYLLFNGYQVVGFDGLSIRESLDANIPIKDFYAWANQMQGKLSGFGGVIDYGITARWDKRLLLLVWLLLKRFPKFSLQGSTRMGGAISIESLKEVGFDHVVMATGAGLPKAHPIQNQQGIYFANEFLMRLHLSGMMHEEVRMGIKLPIVCIGSGLTAIDAATEAQVYYIRWVMQVAFYVESIGLEKMLKGYSEHEAAIVKTWYRHGVYIREHQKDKKALYDYILKEGGVHILYRQSMVKSPAYRTNHHELEKALEQGIQYHENMNPISVTSDHGWVRSIVCEHHDNKIEFEAGTVLIATGSKPNVAYYYENRSTLQIENDYYKRTDEFFADIPNYPNYVSIIGDLHPKYHGSVVGALASAKDSYEKIMENISIKEHLDKTKLLSKFVIQLKEVYEVSKDILGVKLDTQVHLPLGSYVKLSLMDNAVMVKVKAVMVQDNIAWLDRKQEGAELLKAQKPIGILGPSGTRILSQHCSDVIHVVLDKENIIWASSLFYAAKMQNKTAIFYSVEPLEMPIEVDVLPLSLLKGHKSEDAYYCLNAKHLKMVGSYGYSFKACYAICDGPMMCMLKGVCGQCIQWQVDESGKPLKAVFSCSWQAQPITLIDVEHLSKRLKVESLENSMYKKWRSWLREKNHDKQC